MPRERIYTKAGDDGTTGLFYGGRVPKDSTLPTAYGTVDEAQAVLGLARAHAALGSRVETILVPILRDLWVLMAELATLPENRHKLQPGLRSMKSSPTPPSSWCPAATWCRLGSTWLARWFAGPSACRSWPLKPRASWCRI